MAEHDRSEDGKSVSEMRTEGRSGVDIDCEIRIGHGAWRKARIVDLTPNGFQVKVLDMPSAGTPVYLRFAGLQVLSADIRWSKSGTAGCKFASPLSAYVFEHIVATTAVH